MNFDLIFCPSSGLKQSSLKESQLPPSRSSTLASLDDSELHAERVGRGWESSPTSIDMPMLATDVSIIEAKCCRSSSRHSLLMKYGVS